MKQKGQLLALVGTVAIRAYLFHGANIAIFYKIANYLIENKPKQTVFYPMLSQNGDCRQSGFKTFSNKNSPKTTPEPSSPHPIPSSPKINLTR